MSILRRTMLERPANAVTGNESQVTRIINTSCYSTLNALSNLSLLIASQLFPIAFKVASHLTHTVAAKLLAHRICKDEGHHRLTDYSRGRNSSNVRTFKRC